MVAVSPPSHSKKRRRWPIAILSCGGTIKPQTLFMVTVGMSVLFLLSLEPMIVYENDFSTYMRTMQEFTPFIPKAPIRPRRTTPSRYGMVPKTSLRTPILHPVDIMQLETYEGSQQQLRHNVETNTINKESIITQEQAFNSQPHATTAARSEQDSSIRTISVDLQSSAKYTSLQHPRVVSLVDFDGISWSQWTTASPSAVKLPEQSISLELAIEDVASTEQNVTRTPTLPFERPFLEECEPIRNPQVHSTCNFVHELTMESDAISLLSAKGSWRTAWTVFNDTAVLKVLQYQRAFDQEAYQRHALDAIVSDLLTASPYVIDAYGFCGQSILQEWAPSSGRDLVKSYDIGNRQRLKIARDLARGLADLQALQRIPHDSFIDDRNGTQPNLTTWKIPPPPPTVFSHNDINIANTIKADGQVKWNDFNIGVLLRSRIGSNFTEDCGAPVKFQADLWRSPEEVRNQSYVKLQYTDMYGFGNILYQVMSRHQPWTHREPEGQLTVAQVADRKREGRLPTFPEKILNSTNKDIQIMLAATMSCYHPVPSKRLTAYEMAHALSYLYDRRQHKVAVPSEMLRDIFFRR